MDVEACKPEPASPNLQALAKYSLGWGSGSFLAW